MSSSDRRPTTVPPHDKPHSSLPYLWVTLAMFVAGLVFTAVVLLIRPTLDPILVIGNVMGFVITISAGIAAFIKTQETNITVNSRLTEWKREFYDLAHSEGKIAGAKEERMRINDQMRIEGAQRRSDKEAQDKDTHEHS